MRQWCAIVLCLIFLGISGTTRAKEPGKDITLEVVDPRIDTVNGGTALYLRTILHNNSPTIKIDITGDPSMTLTDNFNNAYRVIRTAAADKDHQIPRSLYPGGSFAVHSWFEPPVEGATELTVTLTLPGPVEPVVGHAVLPASQIPRATAIPDADFDFFIETPQRGAAVRAGSQIAIRIIPVDFAAFPDKIHILAFNYVLTDDQAIGNYEIRIPADVPSGTEVPVVIMVEWETEGQEPRIRSKTISLRVSS